MKHSIKHLWLAVLLLLLSFPGFSQYSVTFKPNAAVGQDALLLRNDICTNWVNINAGNSTELDAYGWTWYAGNCGPGTGRSLIRFDQLSTLPAGAVITYAELRLFGVPTSGNTQGNSTYPGSPYPNSNDAWVRRVTSPWLENTVTWNTQPTFTTAGQVAVPASTAQWNNNAVMNVTAQVTAMMLPGANNGFMLMLQNEAHYRSRLFASSDYADAARWPELFIRYDLPCDAGFTYCVSSGNSSVYNFKADNPQPGYAYKWKFGDGTTGSGAAVSHTYATGSYNVCLYAERISTGTAEPIQCEKCVRICVQGTPVDTCSVKFRSQTSNGYLYYFYGLPAGPFPVVDAKWEFGDGATSATWPDVNHEYTQSGTYEVCLTVKYENGCVARYCSQVQVSVPCAVSYQESTNNGYDFSFHGVPGSPAAVTSAKWDFGDGTTATGWPDVNHHYTQPGSYLVCVETKYANGCVARYCKEVIVGCTVTFRTQTENGYLHYFYGVPAGPYPVASAEWDFGDGTTSTEWPNTKHEYASSGSYEVCLTVKYENGCIAKYCYTVGVVVPCNAKFKTETPNGHLYYFYGVAYGLSPVTSAYWDFGDGSSSTDWPTTKHDYTRGGIYRVCLTVRYQNGCEARFCSDISVLMTATCKADFDYHRRGDVFYFAGVAEAADGSPVASAEWDFGDGNTSADWPNARHQYAQPGSYTVCVTVKFENGCQARLCKNIVMYGVDDPTITDADSKKRLSTSFPEPTIRVIPNPVNTGTVKVAMTIVNPGNYYYTIYDANGRAVLTGNKTLGKGEQAVTLSITGITPGMYRIAFRSKDEYLRTGFIRL